MIATKLCASVKPAPPPQPEYPCLKQGRRSQRIVLFTKPHYGVALTNNEGPLARPQEWREWNFDRYEGAIILQNA